MLRWRALERRGARAGEVNAAEAPVDARLASAVLAVYGSAQPALCCEQQPAVRGVCMRVCVLECLLLFQPTRSNAIRLYGCICHHSDLLRSHRPTFRP